MHDETKTVTLSKQAFGELLAAGAYQSQVVFSPSVKQELWVLACRDLYPMAPIQLSIDGITDRLWMSPGESWPPFESKS